MLRRRFVHAPTAGPRPKVRPPGCPLCRGRGRPPGRVAFGDGEARCPSRSASAGTMILRVETLVPAFSIDATRSRTRSSAHSSRTAVPATNCGSRTIAMARGVRPRPSGGVDRHADRWVYRTIFDLLPLEAVGDWAVYVSLAEARAYARWRGARLPTEAEFHRAAFGDAGAGERRFPWGARSAARHGNFNFHQWAPMPVGSHPSGASVWGVQDLIGDGWEWTDTIFEGLPGFEAIPGLPGYSATSSTAKHYVLKARRGPGGRPRRPSFRNWFQAHPTSSKIPLPSQDATDPLLAPTNPQASLACRQSEGGGVGGPPLGDTLTRDRLHVPCDHETWPCLCSARGASQREGPTPPPPPHRDSLRTHGRMHDGDSSCCLGRCSAWGWSGGPSHGTVSSRVAEALPTVVWLARASGRAGCGSGVPGRAGPRPARLGRRQAWSPRPSPVCDRRR